LCGFPSKCFLFDFVSLVFVCRRRKGEKLFLVAFYECNEDFVLENLEHDRLYCSKEAWVGNTPRCEAIEEDENEDDDEEGA
jgi:fibulin 1/2